MANKKITKPAQLSIIDGKRHFTKKEMQKKVNSQLKLGDSVFVPSEVLLKNKRAKKTWDEIIKLLEEADSDFITSMDTHELEKYCLVESEIYGKEEIKQKIIADMKKKKIDEVIIYEEMDKLGIQKEINKLIDLSLRLKKALSLDPLSRLSALKNKEKKPKVNKKDKFEQQFGGI